MTAAAALADHIAARAVAAARKSGRGKSAASTKLIQALFDIYEAIHPASVRAGCYQLFNRKMIPDMKRVTTGKISRLLVWARENDVIPWEWIVDEHRYEERAAQWDNTDEIIDSTVAHYRRDNWQEQPNWLQVWSEKGTVRGSIWPVLEKYGVGFQVAHGFQGASIMHDVASDSALSAKPLTILYVGDRDPSGMYMSEVDIPKRMTRYGGIAAIRRLALTEEDVIGLPSFQATEKVKDPRYSWYVNLYGAKCWELDALSPAILRARVETAILAMIDVDTWNRAVLIEQAEIESFKYYKDRWKESISQLVPKYYGKWQP